MSVEERADRLDPVEDGWLVTISIDDREDQTVAKAKLNFQGREWVGAGLARLAPASRDLVDRAVRWR